MRGNLLLAIAASAMPSWMFWTVIMGWDTGGVALVADDLAAWLTGLLAGAGRKKPVMVVTGTDREWALRPAVTAAVRVTATAAGTAGPDGHAVGCRVSTGGLPAGQLARAAASVPERVRRELLTAPAAAESTGFARSST
jgi:hypothetical protein